MNTACFSTEEPSLTDPMPMLSVDKDISLSSARSKNNIDENEEQNNNGSREREIKHKIHFIKAALNNLKNNFP